MGKFKQISAAAMALFMLSGCFGGPDFGDLQAFMDQVESKPKGQIEPLPEFLPYQAFAYAAGNLRSPFEPPQEIRPVPAGQKKSNVKPDSNRVRQYLEQFNVAQLRMVGTLAQGPAFYGLVQDGNGGVHRVRNGDYMGTDHGRILSINESQIEMIEIVADGTGGWVERARAMSLGGGES